LLTNKHYMEMKYTADPALAEKELQETVAKLAHFDETLSKEEKMVIVDETEKLKKYQETS